MKSLTGTGRLLKLALRRDRLKLPAWIIAITGMMAITVQALKETYGTFADQATYIQLVDTSAIGRLFAGLPGEINIASVIMSETAIYIGLAMAFMNVLLIIRHTRQNEELGSSELLQSAQVGRYSALTSALILAILVNLITAVLLAITLQVTDVVTTEQAWAYGIGQGLVGLSFAAIASVAAQVSESTRVATSLSSLSIGKAFILRAIGDVFATKTADGAYEALWTSWLSPLGWFQLLRPLAEIRWPIIFIFVGGIVAITTVAYILLSRRDVGFGLLPARPGPARASRKLLLASPLGLAMKLQKGVFIGWTIVAVLFATIVGGIADQIGDLLNSSDIMQQYLSGLGGTTQAIQSMLGAMLAIIMLSLMAYVIQATGRIRTEETSNRLEPLLATNLSRNRWMLSNIVLIVTGTAFMTAISGLVVAVTAGLALELPVSEWGMLDYTLAGLSYAPALLIFAGLTIIGIGLYPKLALGVSWLAFTFVVVISQFGALLKLPEWAMKASPLWHVAVAPAEDINLRSTLTLGSITLVLIVVGLIAFRKRDIS